MFYSRSSVDGRGGSVWFRRRVATRETDRLSCAVISRLARSDGGIYLNMFDFSQISAYCIASWPLRFVFQELLRLVLRRASVEGKLRKWIGDQNLAEDT
jgi:hypothetical protein